MELVNVQAAATILLCKDELAIYSFAIVAQWLRWGKPFSFSNCLVPYEKLCNGSDLGVQH